MGTKIAYERVDGGVSIVQPSAVFIETGKPLSEMKGYPKNAEKVIEVETGDIPQDRTFRNAWKLDGEKLKVDMGLALALAQDNIRAKRSDPFKQLDNEWFKATESGDESEAERVKTAKNKLRDAPEDARLLRAKTPDEMKRLMGLIVEEINQT